MSNIFDNHAFSIAHNSPVDRVGFYANIAYMATAKKTTKTVKKTAVKAKPVKVDVKAPAKKEVKNKAVFSDLGSRVSGTKEKLVKSLKTSTKARVIFGGIIVLALVLILLPHLAVAWVDGKPVSIFSYYSALDQKYGKDTKEQMISEKLVEDEASKRGVTVSDTEVSDQIKKLEDQASGSASLNNILAQQGLTRDEFTKQIRLQSLIKKMFASEATVSTQEVDQYIAQNKAQLPDPVDNATRASIQDQLVQQKLVQAFQSWLQTASSSNRVVRL